MILDPERARHTDDGAGRPRPALVWRFPAPVRCLSSAVLGGGLGERRWVVNAEVTLDYRRDDPAAHLRAIAAGFGLDPGAGVGLMTAARVFDIARAADAGAEVTATVGVSAPTWAAAPDGHHTPWGPPTVGTVNLVCWVPVALDDAALVNLAVTVTEAKTQALLDAGVPGTGTASDALAVCCPPGGGEPYGGPRSTWGARLARAAYAAVADGTARFLAGR